MRYTLPMTPLFRKGDNVLMDNCCPMPVLSCFLKILEIIIYNRLYSLLTENNILYKKRFGFQKQNSVDYTMVISQTNFKIF